MVSGFADVVLTVQETFISKSSKSLKQSFFFTIFFLYDKMKDLIKIKTKNKKLMSTKEENSVTKKKKGKHTRGLVFMTVIQMHS